MVKTVSTAMQEWRWSFFRKAHRRIGDQAVDLVVLLSHRREALLYTTGVGSYSYVWLASSVQRNVYLPLRARLEEESLHD